MKSSQSEALPIEDSKAAGIAMAPRIWHVLTLGGRLGRLPAVVAWLTAAVGIGVLFSWNWLVAVGLSSVVLAILPCAVMCAAGLCMGRSGGKCADPSSKAGPDKGA